VISCPSRTRLLSLCQLQGRTCRCMGMGARERSSRRREVGAGQRSLMRAGGRRWQALTFDFMSVHALSANLATSGPHHVLLRVTSSCLQNQLPSRTTIRYYDTFAVLLQTSACSQLRTRVRHLLAARSSVLLPICPIKRVAPDPLNTSHLVVPTRSPRSFSLAARRRLATNRNDVNHIEKATRCSLALLKRTPASFVSISMAYVRPRQKTTGMSRLSLDLAVTWRGGSQLYQCYESCGS
jgi:hypothetical protein